MEHSIISKSKYLIWFIIKLYKKGIHPFPSPLGIHSGLFPLNSFYSPRFRTGTCKNIHGKILPNVFIYTKWSLVHIRFFHESFGLYAHDTCTNILEHNSFYSILPSCGFVFKCYIDYKYFYFLFTFGCACSTSASVFCLFCLAFFASEVCIRWKLADSAFLYFKKSLKRYWRYSLIGKLKV